MDQIQYQRELLSFKEKIALAKLEESKAAERVRELEYEMARFSIEAFLISQQQEQNSEKKE